MRPLIKLFNTKNTAFGDFFISINGYSGITEFQKIKTSSKMIHFVEIDTFRSGFNNKSLNMEVWKIYLTFFFQ